MIVFDRARVLFVLAAAALATAACDERNPLYVGPRPDVPDGAFQADGLPFADAPEAPDGSALIPDGGPFSCSPSACESSFGPPPCGSWTCAGAGCVVMCAACMDVDQDGYGQGPGCAGLDCDDTNPRVRDTVAVRACYTGPAGSQQSGSCHAGTSSCSAGMWSECDGQQLPLAESCNGEDDDCNGVSDDVGERVCGVGACTNTVPACTTAGTTICMPKQATAQQDECGGGDEDCDGAIDEDCDECVRVSFLAPPDGVADGSAARPFRSIQAAIDWAGADADRPQRVCVAASLDCTAVPGPAGRFNQPENQPLIMKNGVFVVGGYEATGWTLCPVSETSTVSQNAPTLGLFHPKGVVFGADIKDATVLSGFRLERSGRDMSTAAAITVDGAKGAIITHISVTAAARPDVALGVDILPKSLVLISRSRLAAGDAITLSAAVRARDASIQLLDNCSAFDARGRCLSDCSSQGAGLWAGNTEVNMGGSFALMLDAATAARVASNTLCSQYGRNSAAIKVEGSSPSTVISGNQIHARRGNLTASGVWFDGCGAHAPWVVDNSAITAGGEADETQMSGILSSGACHPRIEANALITTVGTRGKRSIAGVACTASRNAVSLCQVINNGEVSTGAGNAAEEAVGVFCAAGGCGRISNNKLIRGGAAKNSVGIWLQEGQTRVDRNVIHGGCGSLSSVGIRAVNAAGRTDNNVIFGASCNNMASETAVGLEVLVADRRRELDVHSNTIDVAQSTDGCDGATMVWASASGMAGAIAGKVRNNILSHHECDGALFEARDNRAQPRIFDNNLFNSETPRPLFLTKDEGELELNEINRDGDPPLRRNNIQGRAMFENWPQNLRLQNGSAAINGGTNQAAPTTDYEGKRRDGQPDIGAFER